MPYMKKILLICLSAVAVVFSTFAESADYRLNVQDFTELKVSDNISVVYQSEPDSAGWVRFTCDPSIASKLMFNNNKSRLTIQLSTEEPTVEGSPVVYVSSSVLTKAENSGDSVLVLRNPADINSLKIRVIGNGMIIAENVHASSVDAGITTGCGRIDISGKVKKAKLHNVGTGPIHAYDLESEQTKCIILGTGPIECTVTELLSIYGAGSGTVYYKGSPEVKRRSIGVKTVHADSDSISVQTPVK